MLFYFPFYSKITQYGGMEDGKNVYEHDDDDVYGKNDV